MAMGFRISVWLDLFIGCHDLSESIRFLGWPDGGSFLEQESSIVYVFRWIKAELN